MNTRILELFLKENSAWEDMISRQRKEIPLLDKMILGIVEEKKGLKEEMEKVFQHLREEMHKQEKHMDELKEELENNSVTSFLNEKILSAIHIPSIRFSARKCCGKELKRSKEVLLN